MMSLQELLPHIEVLELGERLSVEPAPRPYSVVAVGTASHELGARRLASARLLRVGWVSMTVTDRSHAVFGCEPILVGPGEDVEAACMAFGLERAGELLEAHPSGTVAMLGGPLPCLDAASEELANVLLQALCRARSAGGMLLGYVPHPCPELFAGWLAPGERSPWSRAESRMFCYVNVEGTVLRLEAYELMPDQHDRVVAIATTQFQRGIPLLAGREAEPLASP